MHVFDKTFISQYLLLLESIPFGSLTQRSLLCNHTENVTLSLQCLDSVNNTVLINGVWRAAQMPRHYKTERTDSRGPQKLG